MGVAVESRPAADRLVGEYRELGVSRVIGMIRDSVDSNEALPHLAEDCRAGGAEAGAEHRPGVMRPGS